MEILVVSREFPPYVLGGLSYHLKYLYGELADRGHEITVLAGKPKKASQTDVQPPDEVTVRWVKFPSMSAYHLQFPLALWRRLRDIDLSMFDVAAVHTELPYSLPIPTVTKLHDAKQEERKYLRHGMSMKTKLLDSLINPTRKWVGQRTLDSADQLIFNSNLTRQVWERYFNVNTNSTIIHNGVDTNVFAPGDGPEVEYYLFVGNSVRKGLPAVRHFAKQSSVPVYAVGGSIEPSTNLKPLGRLSQQELVDYYTGARATIHPAGFEAFGNVILESLACGTPVVVSRSCGAAEIIDDSCGIVTDNVGSKVLKVENKNTESCIKVAQKYSWESVATETMSVMQGIIS